MCTTWGILAPDSNISFSPLQLDIPLNYAPHKCFLYFLVSHSTAASFPTKLYLEFSSSVTIDPEMKEINRRHITSKDSSNSHFPSSFSCAS